MKAIVLKKEKTREYDQWVTCYTEEFGKLKAVAKSSLKQESVQGLHLDQFNLVEFELISGNGLPIITGAQSLDAFLNIKNSVARTAAAYFFAEAIDRLTLENDQDDRLWDFLNYFLAELDALPAAGDASALLALLRRGQTDLLNLLGYLPEVDVCRGCNKNVDGASVAAFNYGFGGMVCKECFLTSGGGVLVSQADYSVLAAKEGHNHGEKTYRKGLLDGMYEYIAGTKFHSLDLLGVIK